ncbi:hypothetical protein EV284_3486 [Streptomyces sp. BK022]|uniref:hypothetical protein n=1 Tax=Streptomyces sp. BK022 TaxID=2512123 RepID=UPI0010289F44|nr:hypothetical protein [Streptomyces sp. BK022]RZU36003.1 hypothetical protein EV284_3486 [Streptomyces sp. BK022]
MATNRQMSRADYETISAAIAESEADLPGRRTVAFDIADALTGTADRYDPVLWLRQCDIGPVSPADVADWSKRLELRVVSIGKRRRTSLDMGYDHVEQYVGADGKPLD